MVKGMWTSAHWASHYNVMGINMESLPLAAITSSTLLGRLSTRCWMIAPGTCFHSATRALVRSGVPIHPKVVWFGWGQGSAQASQVLSPRSRQSASVRMTSLCARGHCHAEAGKGKNCFYKDGSTESSRMLFYAVSLRFPFTGTKGARTMEKQPQTIIPPPPNFIVGTMHSGRSHSPGIRHT